AGEAELGEQPDSIVIGIDLVPGQSVARRDGVGMVIVVPAFAAGEERDPPTVAGVVAGLKPPRAPHVGGGVDEPGGVQADGNAKKDAPKQKANGADRAAAVPSKAEEQRAADGAGQ